MHRKILSVIGIAVFILMGCKEVEIPKGTSSSEQVQTYTCAHHPEVIQNSPGTCPKCGMQLTPK